MTSGHKLANKQIAIVGGGPGGLILARLLQLKGATVKVYERDLNQVARVQGSPLDMHQDSGLAALREANLLEEFGRNFLPGADKTLIVNERAEVFYSDHQADRGEASGSDAFRPEIDRGALRKMLLASLQPETVVWNSHFVSMANHEGGWLLQFKNTAAAYADLVIAADGANSKIRPYITDAKPFYSGITMIEGYVQHAATAIPQVYGLANGGKIMAFGNQKNLLMGTKEAGGFGFYASLKLDEDWGATSGLDYADNAQMVAWFKQEYAGWSPVWHELFANAMVPFVPRPIYCAPLTQTWETLPNATLLGDAAHVMPPFAGEGANMAMLDALELSTCLTSDQFATVPEALAFYEQAMRARGAKAAQDSLENGERMHSEGALDTMLAFFNNH